MYIMMFDRLLKTRGFPWAMRAIGFVALAAALFSIPALLSGSSVLATKRKARALFDKTAYKDRLFLVFTACSFSTFLGYIPQSFAYAWLGDDAMGYFWWIVAAGFGLSLVIALVTWAIRWRSRDARRQPARA